MSSWNVQYTILHRFLSFRIIGEAFIALLQKGREIIIVRAHSQIRRRAGLWIVKKGNFIFSRFLNKNVEFSFISQFELEISRAIRDSLIITNLISDVLISNEEDDIICYCCCCFSISYIRQLIEIFRKIKKYFQKNYFWGKIFWKLSFKKRRKNYFIFAERKREETLVF